MGGRHKNGGAVFFFLTTKLLTKLKKKLQIFFPSWDNFCNFVSFSLSSPRPLHPRPELVRETSPAPIFCNQRWTVEKGL